LKYNIAHHRDAIDLLLSIFKILISMKKILIFFAFSILTFSCSKSDINTKVEGTAATFTFDANKLLSLLHDPSSFRQVLDSNDFITYLSENLDTLGIWHNDLMAVVFSRMTSDQLSPCDTSLFRASLNTYVIEFYKSKGIDFNQDVITYYLNELDGEPMEPRSELSQNANDFLSNLQSQMDIVDLSSNESIENFKDECDLLKISALEQLSSDEEKVVVGSAISVAKNSLGYWSVNFEDWFNYLSNFPCSGGNASRIADIDPRAKRVFQHDAAGAVAGAIGGMAGGPVGAFAGALVASGSKSVIHAICEGFNITHITDWFGL
jgi:hypothetical protein